MYNLDVKVFDKKTKFQDLSLSVFYLLDDKNLKKNLKKLEKELEFELSELQLKNFDTKEYKKIRTATRSGKPDEVIITKIPFEENFTVDFFRNDLASLLPSIETESIENLYINIPEYDEVKNHFDDEEYYYQTFVEGLIFGNYRFDHYKLEKKDLKDLEVYFSADDNKKLYSAVETAHILMEGVFFSRDLQNEPAITLTPSELANRVNRTLSKEKVKVRIFDEKEIKKRNMGGLIAVGQGSENPPRFVVMEYKPSGKRRKKIALVGKGITFDSGGISIKPHQNMGDMKADMSGAAVVAGTLLAAAKNNLPVEIIGIIPAAENMLSGKAFRPGDIIRTASGKSIEIGNTDAEGRVILADALDYASKEKPDMIIDLATLTGACVVALGEFAAGTFTKDEIISNELFKSGLRTYDRVWGLPMWDDYNKLIESDVADVSNIGSSRWGGAITAAKFLEHFVDKKIPWVHLDIAGPSMPNNNNNYNKKYFTGFGVRLLFDYLKNV